MLRFRRAYLSGTVSSGQTKRVIPTIANTVSLTAYSNPGYTFSSWMVTGPVTVSNYQSATATLSVNANGGAVTAIFSSGNTIVIQTHADVSE